jgi:cytochrome c-type biogenesis protein CcmH
MNPSSNLKVSILGTLTLVALGMYFAVTQFANPVGQDLMPDFMASEAAIPSSGSQDSSASLAPVDQLLVGLEQRLEEQPDDVDGWILLSKSYFHLNRLKEAKAVFEKAKGLGYTGNWKPLPRIDSFSQNSFSSQSLSSSGSFKDYKMDENITQTNSQYDATASQTESIAATGLRLKISLNPILRQELSPDYPVFIFVRAADNPGPPLAVVRKEVGELPFELVLNDSHAMMPGRTISSAENVIVGARVSISGNPQRHPGDYEQLSKSIPSNSSTMVELVINNRI